MTNLLKDLNILTNIPEKSLVKLVSLATTSIGNAVWEAKQDAEAVAAIDMGVGILHIKVPETSAGEVKYHFEPSDALRTTLKNVTKNNGEPLTARLVTSLKNKFLDVYKEIC